VDVAGRRIRRTLNGVLHGRASPRAGALATREVALRGRAAPPQVKRSTLDGWSRRDDRKSCFASATIRRHRRDGRESCRPLDRLPAPARQPVLAVGSDSPAQRPAYLVWAADQNGNLLYVRDPEGAVVRLMDSVTLGGALE